MKIFIALLLIFSSLGDGRDLLSISTDTLFSTEPSTTVPITTMTPATTAPTTTTSTTTSTSNTETSTISNTTKSPTTTTVTTTLVPVSTTTTPSPTAGVTVNVTWTFTSKIDITNVVVTVGNLKSKQYAAIGLGQTQSMGETHVFMCKRHPDDKVVIERYINRRGHAPPESAGSEQGGIFTPLPSKFTDGVSTCQFNLSNFTTSTVKQLNELRPLSQSGSYYPLFAVGSLDSDNEPQEHDSKEAQANVVQLNTNEMILYRIAPGPTPDNPIKYIKAHGIIMVITWIFIVSTGVLISRYFKKSWAKKFLCGKPAWFTAHRFLMSLAAILTTLGFLFILVARKGAWPTSEDESRHFIHTITGALVISFAFFQPFIALFRCEPDSRYRFIFNYLHAFVGFGALLLSIVTIFLATYFQLFKDDKPRTIMIVWTIWIIFIFIAFEIVQHYFGMRRGDSPYSKINSSNTAIAELTDNPTSPTSISSHDINEYDSTAEDKAKHVLLAVHILIAAILSIIFSTLIA